MGKLAIVMSGGGAKGAFELGAVDYLVNHQFAGRDVDVIAGISVGSLNAAMLAQGKGRAGLVERVVRLKDLWLGLTDDAVYRSRLLGKLFVFLWNNSIYDSSPIHDRIRKEIDPGALRESGRQFRIGAVALESGAFRAVGQDAPDIHSWILASSSMPLFFSPVAVAGCHGVDGGVRNVTPLREAFDGLQAAGGGDLEDQDEMWVLFASPLAIDAVEDDKVAEMLKNGLGISERAVNILVNQIYREDVQYALDINASVRGYLSAARQLRARGLSDADTAKVLGDIQFRPPKYRPVKMWAVVPPVLYMDALDFDPAKIRQAYAAGQQAAATPLDEEALRRLLAERLSVASA
jgi:NTE family protein